MAQVFEKLSATELINLSVGELADRFSCSRRHLNRLFHQHFGVSVASNAKIINVAEQCGFNHLGLFNTCFKRRFGASPGQWRKSALQAEKTSADKHETKPVCPLRSTGLCPMGGQLGGSPPTATASLASKISDEGNLLEDLKRRDLMFGTQASSNNRRDLPQSRTGE
jgi:AraC-like DNA-binding protein